MAGPLLCGLLDRYVEGLLRRYFEGLLRRYVKGDSCLAVFCVTDGEDICFLLEPQEAGLLNSLPTINSSISTPSFSTNRGGEINYPLSSSPHIISSICCKPSNNRHRQTTKKNNAAVGIAAALRR